jgi:hypothetical protein
VEEGKGKLSLGQFMDLGIVAGIVLLVVWAISTFMFNGPGWVNLLLTLGVTIIIWRIVARGTRGVKVPAAKDETQM